MSICKNNNVGTGGGSTGSGENEQPDRPQLENTPLELCHLAQWVLWRYERRDGKQTKVPYQEERCPCSAELVPPLVNESNPSKGSREGETDDVLNPSVVLGLFQQRVSLSDPWWTGRYAPSSI